MKVLITGSGAREHALAWAIARSPRVERVYVAPGNGGTGQVGTNVPVADVDVPGLVALARREGIGLAVLGPEASVMAGAADALREAGVPCFGPSRDAGRIEGSKAFAKELMDEAGIPTAAYRVVGDVDAGLEFACLFGGRVAVKADGLAQGKGVVVCGTLAEAEAALRRMLDEGEFGSAGARVVVEERMVGPELSMLALTDGAAVVPLAPARDFKRAHDGDAGPNTGGMGAYSPPLGAGPDVVAEAVERVLRPAVDAMRARGLDYRGVLYAGLMLTPAGMRVVEFNCRFGDPEAQVQLPRLTGDVVPLLEAAATGTLATAPAPEWDPRPAVGVVVASGGYPGAYETGHPIAGLDAAAERALVFHAGTRRDAGAVRTAGGRVLTVVGMGADVAAARAEAVRAAAQVAFPGAFHRHDIAKEDGAL
jgi:phosphoribosylamine---glycine ligase